MAPLPTLQQATEASGESALVAAVRAELDGLQVSEVRPALAAIPLTLAETQSKPPYGSSHAAVARELARVLDAARAAPEAEAAARRA